METWRRIFPFILTCGLLALGPAAYGAEQGGAEGLTAPFDAMTVAPNLVSEGLFAVELVNALQLGRTEDEAQAEKILSSKGIEPQHGWITDYPVTPATIGEIERGVAAAAAAGKLGVGKDQALKAVRAAKENLGLNVAPGTASVSVPPPPRQTIYKYVDRDGVIHYTDRYEGVPREYRGRAEKMLPAQAEPAGPPYDPGNLYAANEAPPAYDASAAPPPPAYEDAAHPAPEVVNNYYVENGPPVITYYAPPQPYYYLYSWVPYPFWYARFYFPGFFILNNFHRHVFCQGRPLIITNHVVRHSRTYFVHPRHRTLVGKFGPGKSPSQDFRSPAVQSSAQAILRQYQPRMSSGNPLPGPRVPHAISRQYQPRTSFGNPLPGPRVPQAVPGRHHPRISSGNFLPGPKIPQAFPSPALQKPQAQHRAPALQRPQAQYRVFQRPPAISGSQPRTHFGPPRIQAGPAIARPAITGRPAAPPASAAVAPPSFRATRVPSAPAAAGRSGGFHGGGGGRGHR